MIGHDGRHSDDRNDPGAVGQCSLHRLVSGQAHDLQHARISRGIAERQVDDGRRDELGGVHHEFHPFRRANVVHDFDLTGAPKQFRDRLNTRLR